MLSRITNSIDEIFSKKDLAIPYAAVMAIYKTEKSTSMTHSYARSYSKREIKEGRTICTGNEGCWVIRDNKNIR